MTAPAASIHDVPDDLLRLMLLRLDSPLWLVRAAATCKRWRRVVAADGGAFFRLARSLHPPTVVGHYHLEPFTHSSSVSFVPSSPPAPIDYGCFSLDFLPFDVSGGKKTSRWQVDDCHDGLVLLKISSMSRSFLVCDPLTRQYQEVQKPGDREEKQVDFVLRVYLLNGEDGDISISNFRLFFWYRDSSHRQRACVFSTADDGHWSFLLPSQEALSCLGLYPDLAGRVDGCLYLVGTIRPDSFMVLDNASLQFSKVNLPSSIHMSGYWEGKSTYIVVHGKFGSSTTSRIVHVYGDELEVFGRVHGSGEWVIEHSVRRLSEATHGLSGFPADTLFDWNARVFSNGTGFVVLKVEAWDPVIPTSRCISVDVETMEMKVVPESAYHNTWCTWSYALPWPSFIREFPSRV
jgi:hypothetical protein